MANLIQQLHKYINGTKTDIFPIALFKSVFTDDGTKNLDAVLGSTDISSIGDGTVTGAISKTNETLTKFSYSADLTLNGSWQGTLHAVKLGKLVMLCGISLINSTTEQQFLAYLPTELVPIIPVMSVASSCSDTTNNALAKIQNGSLFLASNEFNAWYIKGATYSFTMVYFTA